MEERVVLNWHTTLMGSPIVIEVEYCLPCIPEVIQYRTKIRSVADMTTDLVSKFNAQRAWEQECDKSNRVKHI